ncbi:MAG: HD-GYP domain-containing protein [Thermacetogeniaceae bacterium]
MKLPVSYLLPGMVLARPVYGLKGELLLNKGTVLTASYIFALRRRGVMAVHVQGPLPFDPTEALKVLDDEVRAEAMNAVRVWVERGRRRADFSGVIDQVANVVEEILSGKVPCGSLSEISSADIYTFAHSVDVCILSVTAGVKMGFKRKDLMKLGIGALLHDLGKTKVPPEILNKPGKLTEEEFKEIKKHPVWGYKMIIDEPDSRVEMESLLVMLNHHEKYDGSGYPRGLKGDEVGIMPAICAAADIYNAITTDRVYRKAML